MRAINIVGFKNSGKTHLVLELAKALEAQGLSVGIVKQSHHTLDAPQSDTGRFRTPHSGRTVLALGQGETALYWGQDKDLTDVLSFMQADIILIEGAKSRDFLPRILCLRAQDTQENLAEELQSPLALATYSIEQRDTGLTGKTHFSQLCPQSIEGLTSIIIEKAFALPRLNCTSCGYDSCAQLARAIVAGEKKPQDCPVLQGKVYLQVNGKSIALNPFTARIVAGAMHGMVQELKGVEKDAQEQNIHFSCTI